MCIGRLGLGGEKGAALCLPPPLPAPLAESKSLAFCRVSFPLPEHVEPAPRERFDKQEAE